MIKVLVVEDETLSREALVTRLRHMLKQEGVVESAEDGNQAIRRALEIHPDLVLMDIVMPRMNGLEASAVISEHLPKTVIVFLTAYDSFDYAVQAMRVGGRDYLLKPVSEQDLRQLLTKLFGIPTQPSEAQEKSPFVTAFETWLYSHYAQDVSLEDAAYSMGMSASYFARKVKAETGATFLEKLTELRVSRAKRRLDTTALTVGEIGRGVGYADPNYFVKVFKRATGMTPSEYRAAGVREQGAGSGEQRNSVR